MTLEELLAALKEGRVTPSEAMADPVLVEALAEAGARNSAVDVTHLRAILEHVIFLLAQHPDEAANAKAAQAALDATAPAAPPAAAPAQAIAASDDTPVDGFLIEAVEPEGRVIDVLAIRSGMSKNRKRYGASVLREAVERGVFNGAKAFASDGPDHDRAKRGVKALVGWWDNARFGSFPLPSGGTAEGVAAHFHPTDQALRATLREAIAQGRHDLIGFSIFGDGPVTRLPDGSFNVDRIDTVESIDPVIHPAAGGQALRLVASEGTMNCTKCGALIEGDHVCATNPTPDVAALVEAAIAPFRTSQLIEAEIASRPGLPDATKTRIRELATGHILDAAGVTALVETEASYLASLTPARVTDSGTTITPGQDERDKMVESLTDVLEGKSPSLRRVYEDLTGDRGMTGKLQESSRLSEAAAIGTGTFPLLLQDAMYKVLLQEYRKPILNDWQRIVSAITPVTDFRARKGIRIGGYGDLATVAAGDAYLAITPPAEEEVTIPAVTKKGGIEDLTMEAIANDDVRGFRRIPVSLARAAQRTLYKGVFDVLRTNMVYTGDTKALFHNDHGNLGSAAFSGITLAAARLAMTKQAELTSAERLGITPKFLVIPPDLTQTAITLIRTPRVVDSAENTYNFAGSIVAEADVIEVPYWTDTNNWYLVADPAQYDTIEVCFFNGQQEPELLLQDQPNLGDNFAKDVLTWKIRHIWSVALLDTKPMYGAVVA